MNPNNLHISRSVLWLICLLVGFIHCILPDTAYAQLQASNWYFPVNAGLVFTNAGPVPISGASPFGTEGSATISDNKGRLLFYGSPETLFNRLHKPMLNGSGLLGGNSSTQGIFIAPLPGNDSFFYVFTLDDFQHGLKQGLNYNIVNMCLDNGYGAIIPGSKNIHLMDSAGEKMAGAFHANGTDIWIVVHKHWTSQFYAFLLTKSGISKPVISDVGAVHINPDYPKEAVSSIGQMKISPDGKRLALAACNVTPTLVELFDFDNGTGKVSNAVKLTSGTTDFGVAFSPDNSKLYISELSGMANAVGLVQFDLNAGSDSAINNSRTTLINKACGGLQLGIDGRIYVQNPYNTRKMHVIRKPNGKGLANIDLGLEALDLGKMDAQYTPPSFIDNFDYYNKQFMCSCEYKFTFLNQCEGDSTVFTITDTAQAGLPDSALWLFGDPASSLQNTSRLLQPRHLFTGEGIYKVTLISYRSGLRDTFSKTLEIYPTPRINFPIDTFHRLCIADSVKIGSGLSNVTYAWANGYTRTTDSAFKARAKGWLKLTVTNPSRCFDKDSLFVDEVYAGDWPFIHNLTMCGNNPVKLKPRYNTLFYDWNTGFQGKELIVTKPGSYRVYSYNRSHGMLLCKATDSFIVKQSPSVPANLGKDTFLCKGSAITLKTHITNAQHLWSDGSTNSSLQVTNGGIYWVKVIYPSGCVYLDTINVTEREQLDLHLPADTIICEGDSIRLDVTVPGATYYWNDGNTHATRYFSKAGRYWVSANTANCSGSDTILVKIRPKPTLTLTGDTLKCSKDTVTLTAIFQNADSIRWSTGESTSSIRVFQDRTYTATAYSLCKPVSRSLAIRNISQPKVELGQDTTLCPGRSLRLDAGPDGNSYLWQDGSSDRFFTVTQPGTYRVEVTGKCGTAFDSIRITYEDPLSLELGKDTTLCAGQTITIRAGNGGNIIWNNGQTGDSITVIQSGIYRATKSNGCESISDEIRVDFLPLPIAGLGPDTTICIGNKLELNISQPGTSFTWSDGYSSAHRTLTESGAYPIKIWNQCGIVYDTLHLTVDSCNCHLFVPRAFTPDNTPPNDVFRPQICPSLNYQMIVFNRWGERIFSTTNPAEGWNGQFRNVDAPEGMYIYQINVQDTYYRWHNRHGAFYLLR